MKETTLTSGLMDHKMIVKSIREDLKRDKIPIQDVLKGIRKVKNDEAQKF